MVKSMSRKTVSFGQLLDYLNEPKEKGPALLQNFRVSRDDLPGIHGEFLENARLLPTRRNGNVLYHEILSFSDLDRNRVTPAILEDLTRQYLTLRAPYALAYAKAHFNTACPHVHLVISANDLRDSRRRRLSKADFHSIKRELEQYQMKRYPLLAHSTVYRERVPPSRPRRRRTESERSRRLLNDGRAKPTRKDALRELFVQALTRASSGEAFLRELARDDLRLGRRGRTAILEDRTGQRRYRLRTLGLEEPFCQAVRAWEALPARLETIATLELEQARQCWAELGFREDLLAIIRVETASPGDEVLRSRLAAISQIERAKRQERRTPER